eukprot:gnl/TRDRNA2_/TRDRNA2_141455_c1_seq1.p1 gnl/TRDRNA2_/TRDRNA2_141455_c1~~gnl/TRDRNA2_/TRDRNA2_141455_c1_seq1.p1  ORF type:complete len:787 (-),score=175.16 gnl/TRDRNA2_/TRDRNA2_141455_c1_seq1:121-2481(-)
MINFDVVQFYEPTQSLLPEESGFALNVISEKLKMIFDVNPTIAPVHNFGQIERMKEMLERHEITKLRKELKNQNKKMNDLKLALVAEKNINKAQSEPGAQGGRDVLRDKLILDLEEKISDLQAVRKALKHDLKDSNDMVEALKVEAEEWKDYFKQKEDEVGLLRQQTRHLKQELEISKEREAELEESERSFEQRCVDLESRVDSWQRMAGRRGANSSHPQQMGFGSSDEDGEQLDKDLAAGAGTKSETQATNASCDDNGEHVTESSELLEALLSRDRAHMRVSELESECWRLREALHKQAHGLILLDAETSLEEAEGVSRFSQQVRSGFLEDEGLVHDEASVKGATLTKEEQEELVQNLDRMLSDEIATLRKEVVGHEKPTTTDEDVRWAENVAETERRITAMKGDKMEAEGKLLATQVQGAIKKYKAFASQLEAVEQNKSGSCTCGGVDMAREMYETLGLFESLLPALASKLQTSAAENVRMHQTVHALNTEVRRANTLATDLVDRHPEFLEDTTFQQMRKQLRKVAIPNVFDRLWHIACVKQQHERKRKRTQRRVDLLKDTVWNLTQAPQRIKLMSVVAAASPSSVKTGVVGIGVQDSGFLVGEVFPDKGAQDQVAQVADDVAAVENASSSSSEDEAPRKAGRFRARPAAKAAVRQSAVKPVRFDGGFGVGQSSVPNKEQVPSSQAGADMLPGGWQPVVQASRPSLPPMGTASVPPGWVEIDKDRPSSSQPSTARQASTSAKDKASKGGATGRRQSQRIPGTSSETTNVQDQLPRLGVTGKSHK